MNSDASRSASTSTSASMDIPAPAAKVIAVIADVAAYPEWIDALTAVVITVPGQTPARPRRARFTMDASIFRDDYELEYRWFEDEEKGATQGTAADEDNEGKSSAAKPVTNTDGWTVTWDLVSSEVQRFQHGSYTVIPTGDASCTVTYALTVEPAVPVLGMLKRRAERHIVTTALDRLKARVMA